MKRRTFIALGSGIPSFSILSSFAQKSTQVPDSELLGKTKPALFDGSNFNLRKEAADAFTKMQAAAKQDGMNIYSVSSYRSFDHQQRIWNRKYAAYQKTMKDPNKIISAIIEYSSIPGTSRHHWGTDADLIDESQKKVKNPLYYKHFMEGGIYEKFYGWMNANANDFGFYEVYTDDLKRSGYNFEPWHWSYAPLSLPFIQQWKQIDLHEYIAQPPLMGREQLTKKFLENFRQKWGFGINAALLPK